MRMQLWTNSSTSLYPSVIICNNNQKINTVLTQFFKTSNKTMYPWPVRWFTRERYLLPNLYSIPRIQIVEENQLLQTVLWCIHIYTWLHVQAYKCTHEYLHTHTKLNAKTYYNKIPERLVKFCHMITLSRDILFLLFLFMMMMMMM